MIVDGFFSFLLFAVLFYVMMRFGCGVHMMHGNHGVNRSASGADKHIDPVCGKRINRNKAHIAIEYKGREFLLCCPVCQAEFERQPEKFLR